MACPYLRHGLQPRRSLRRRMPAPSRATGAVGETAAATSRGLGGRVVPISQSTRGRAWTWWTKMGNQCSCISQTLTRWILRRTRIRSLRTHSIFTLRPCPPVHQVQRRILAVAAVKACPHNSSKEIASGKSLPARVLRMRRGGAGEAAAGRPVVMKEGAVAAVVLHLRRRTGREGAPPRCVRRFLLPRLPSLGRDNEIGILEVMRPAVAEVGTAAVAGRGMVLTMSGTENCESMSVVMVVKVLRMETGSLASQTVTPALTL